MAVEIESFIRAWAQVIGTAPATYGYTGDGIASITRAAAGTYDHVLSEEFDRDRVGFEVTPFFTEAQGAGFVAANIGIDAVISPNVRVRFAITSTEASDDPGGWTFLVIAGNAEAQLVAVV